MMIDARVFSCLITACLLISACDIPYRGRILSNSHPDQFNGMPPFASDYRAATPHEAASLFEQICVKSDRTILSDKDAFTNRGGGHFRGRHTNVKVMIKGQKSCYVSWISEHESNAVTRLKPTKARIFGPNKTRYGTGWGYIL